MHKTVPKSYFLSLVRVSTLVVAGGALLTAAGFYLAPHDRVESYADSYRLLAELDHALVTRSLALFFFTLLLMLAGVVVISIAYSHRVAGPLHKLGMHARKIASGDLTKQVRLRSNDVVHELADDINSLSNRYRGLLARLDMKTRELSAILDDSGKQASQRDGDALTGEIAERIEEIRSLVNQIRL